MTPPNLDIKQLPPAGVYAIQNNVTGRVYVGQSENLALRLNQHRRDMVKGEPQNPGIWNDLQEHGLTSFSFEVLERTTNPYELRRIEREWAAQLGAHDPIKGYNLQPIREPEIALSTDIEPSVSIIERLWAVRLEQKRSRISLAAAIGVHSNTLRFAEIGQTTIGIDKAELWARELGLELVLRLLIREEK